MDFCKSTALKSENQFWMNNGLAAGEPRSFYLDMMYEHENHVPVRGARAVHAGRAQGDRISKFDEFSLPPETRDLFHVHRRYLTRFSDGRPYNSPPHRSHPCFRHSLDATFWGGSYRSRSGNFQWNSSIYVYFSHVYVSPLQPDGLIITLYTHWFFPCLSISSRADSHFVKSKCV